MKNLYLKTAKLMSVFALMILFSGCEQDSISPDSPFVYTGDYDDDNYYDDADLTFWTDTYGYGTITVDLYDSNSNYIESRTITTYFTSSPDCGSSGCANFYGLAEGTYYFYASTSNGYYWQNSTYIMDGCNKMMLY